MTQLFFLVKHLFSPRSQYHASTSVYKDIAIVLPEYGGLSTRGLISGVSWELDTHKQFIDSLRAKFAGKYER